MLDIENLVQQLPECYQPIYGHDHLSRKVSRSCHDRLKEIKKVYVELEKIKKRPLKVLDLGCAQGFFCFSLAELGAEVTGVDFLDKNIEVCNEIKKENDKLKVQFIHGKIENILKEIKSNEYDVVLGLSVFHHLIHEHGLIYVKELISKTLENISVGLFELALKEENYYWADALPPYPIDLFDDSSFFSEIGCFKTHLTNIERPLYFCSKDFWYLNSTLEKVDVFSKSPHKMESNPHKDSRRYFSNEKVIIKHFLFTHQERGEHNKKELLNEISFFEKYASISDFKMIDSIINKHYGIIVLEKVEGFLISDFIENNKEFDEEKIIKGILKKASVLENNGLYHNDIRSWNVLIDKLGHPILIDYGSISEEKKDCTWPQNVYLSFFIFVNEISSKSTESPTPIRQLKLSPFSLPKKYQKWGLSLWAIPAAKWSFKLMLKKLEEEKTLSPTASNDQINLTFFKEIEDAVNHVNNHVKHLTNQIDYYKNLEIRYDQQSKKIESLLNEKNELINNRVELLGSLNKTENWGKDLEQQIFSLHEHIKNKDLFIKKLEHLAEQNHQKALEQEDRAVQAEHLVEQNHQKALEQEDRAVQAEHLAEQNHQKALEQEDRAVQAEHLAEQNHQKALEQEDRAVQAEHWGKDLEKQIFNQNEHLENKDFLIKTLEHNRETQQQLITELQIELNAVYNSKSWKLTSFLRTININLKNISSKLKQNMKLLLSRVLKIFSNKPRVKYYIIKLENKLPLKLKMKLRNFYRKNVLGLTSSGNFNPTDEKLTPREKLIKEIITKHSKV